MLAQDVRFHPDEALYATYARRMAHHGDFLLADVPLDKPPLGLALTALSFGALGSSEFAGRLPTVFVSIALIAAVYALARQLYGLRTVALIAGLLMALCPMLLAFAATLFHDPALTLWLVLLAFSAAADRWHGAGIFAALAIATKQSAVQFIPLYAAAGLGRVIRADWTPRDYWRRLRAFALPIIAGAALLALWSAVRAYPVDFWTLGVINPGALRLIRSDEVIPRLARWLEMLLTLGGYAMLVAPLALLIPERSPRRRLIDVLLAMGLVLSLLAYWLLAYNTYDRYLYPLIPPLLLLIARALARWRAALLVGLAALLPFTASALRGDLPVGGDRGAHIGIERLSAAINALPDGAVVYDFWLGWELGYYLGERPTARVIFQPTAEAFARAVCTEPVPRYFAAPAGRSARWLATAEARGARIEQLLTGNFELHRLVCAGG